MDTVRLRAIHPVQTERQGWLAYALHAFRRSNKWGYVFILPLLIDFLVFTLYLTIYAVKISLQEMSAGRFQWVGLLNYRQAFTDEKTWNALRVTTIYTLGVVVLGLLLALVLSELVFRRSQRVQIFFKSAFYLPGVVSTIVLSLVWYWIFNPYYGILNAIIGLVEIPPQNWLGNPDLALVSVMFMVIVGGGGGAVVLITAAMGGIPTELYDSAQIDGAGEWARFWRVTLPLLRPTLLYLFVTGFIGHFQAFDQIYVMTSGGPGYPGATETLGFLIYDSAFRNFQIGKGAALSLFLFLIILVFSVAQFRIFASELEY
ncbi:MAG: carbohydrate ABC transporter permease [Anaerolineae bacterium]